MKILFFFLSCLLFVGCKGNKVCNPNKEITVHYNKSTDILKVVDECDSDRLISEQQILRLPDNSVVPNGYYRDYHLNGKIKTFGFFKKGVQDSIGVRYFDNGKKEAVNYFSRDGQLTGPQYLFHNNGEVRTINFCKNDTNVWFTIEFDKDGKELKTQGYPLKLLAHPGYEILKAGEDFAVINQVALFDGKTAVLHLELSLQQQKIVDTIIKTFVHANNTDFYPFVKKMDKKGQYIYKAQVQIIDSIGKTKLFEYQTSKVITVK